MPFCVHLIGLDRACHFVGTQAAGAGMNVAGRTTHNCLDALYVGLPGTVASPVGVGNLDSERDTFTADVAFSHSLHLLHRGQSVRKVNVDSLSDFSA